MGHPMDDAARVRERAVRLYALALQARERSVAFRLERYDEVRFLRRNFLIPIFMSSSAFPGPTVLPGLNLRPRSLL